MCVKCELVALLPARPVYGVWFPVLTLSLCYPIRRPMRRTFYRPIYRPVVETRDPELARDICRTLLLRICCCLEVRTLEDGPRGGGNTRNIYEQTDIVASSMSTTYAVAYADLFAKNCVYRRSSLFSSMFCINDMTLFTKCTHTRFSSRRALALLLSLLVSCFLPQPPKARRVRLCIRRLHDQNLGFQRP